MKKKKSSSGLLPNMSKRDIEGFIRPAFDKVAAENQAMGLPSFHIDERGEYMLYSDGRKEYL